MKRRKLICNASMYGNGLDEADLMEVQTCISDLDEMKKYPNTRHRRHQRSAGKSRGSFTGSVPISFHQAKSVPCKFHNDANLISALQYCLSTCAAC